MFKLLKWLCRNKVIRIAPSDTVIVSSDDVLSRQSIDYAEYRWQDIFGDSGPGLVILDRLHIEGVITTRKECDDN